MSHANTVSMENEIASAIDVGIQAGGNSPRSSGDSTYWCSYRLREAVIRELGGYKYWDMVPKHLKSQLFYEGLLKWKKRLYARYGSQVNYIRHWVREKGYENLTDYKYKKAKESGFETYNDYLNFLYRRKGFTGRAQYKRFKRFQKKMRTSNPAITRSQFWDMFESRELLRACNKEQRDSLFNSEVS